MSEHFWDEAILLIFFGYGLAFYSLGLALLVESGRASELGFARSMRLLAGFGLLHGIHEWIDLFERGLDMYYDKALPDWLIWLRLALLVSSFLALMTFGESLLRHELTNKPIRWQLTIAAVIWYTISVIIVRLLYHLDDLSWSDASDVLARYVLGVPSALLACSALWQQRHIFRERGMTRFIDHLTLGSIAICLYGVVGQIFTKESEIFPSTFLNADFFQRTFGFPVQLFRAVLALVVTVAMIRVLRALEVENQQRLDSIKESQERSEQQSREELARLNAELRAANEETAKLLRLRGELIQRITTAQEAERKRIARELHDGTGQALTGVAMGLRGLAISKQEPEVLLRRLADLEAITTTALGELRLLINDLRPPQLDDMGLTAALRWMVERANERYPQDFELDIQGDPRHMPPEIETTLFRITQEGMNNVIKHAQAAHIRITLIFNKTITLTIQDDGVGFDPSAALNPDSFRTAWGLLGMQERASLINATLTIDSIPGKGTCLTVQLTPEAVPEVTG